MKNLDFFKNDIKKCSRCGLCQAVCPVYKATKNDCTSPRGKFILINEMFKNNLKPSEKLKNYMKMCINCKKCVDYCPSKINTPKINEAFFKDYNYFKFNFWGILIFIKFILNVFENILIKKKLPVLTSKIVYLAHYEENNIPKNLNEYEYKIVNCGIPIEFAFLYPDLYKKMSKISAHEVLENKPDIVLTKNLLCKTQLQTGLKLLNSKIKIHYIK